MIDKLQNSFAFICSKIDIKVVFFIWIFLGTSFYHVVEPYDFLPPDSAYWFIMRIIKYSLLGLAVLFTIPVIVKRKFEFSINKTVILLGFYVLACFLSILLNSGEFQGEGFYGFEYMLYQFLLFLIMIYMLKNDDHKKIIYALCVLIFFNSVLSYIGFAADNVKSGFFGERNYFGRLMVVIITYLTIMLFNIKSKIKKYLLLFGILMLFTDVLLLQGRGAYLVSLLSFTAIILSTKNKKIILLCGMLLCVVIAPILGYATIKRMRNDGMNVVNYSDAGRIWGIHTAFNMWKANPVLGVGLRISQFRVKEYENIHIFGFTNTNFAIHCTPMMILAETGTAGFVLYYSFSAMLLFALIRRFKGKKNLVKESPYELFYLLALCIYLVTDLFLPLNFYEGYYFYLSAGAVILLRSNKNNNSLKLLTA